jgi:hypothetical protein
MVVPMRTIEITADPGLCTLAGSPSSGWALSEREVAIPVAALEAGRVPAISVRSGKPASAAIQVIHRSRLIPNRGFAWGLLMIGDWGGLIVALVLLPTVFLLYPHSKWLTRALPRAWRAKGVLPVTAGEARWMATVQRGASASGLGAALLIAAAIIGVPNSVAPLANLALFALLLIGVVLGGIDYASLPVSNLATVAGQRVVILHGVHRNFAAAIQTMST